MELLISYRKNLQPTRQLQLDDVVIVKDDTLMVRGKYPLGVILEQKFSRTEDNVVRSAIVRIPAGPNSKERILRRASDQLAPLEIIEKESPYI